MTTLYSNIADILILARQRSYRAVNRTMIEAYWLIGQQIVEEEQKGLHRAEYGKNTIRRNQQPALFKTGGEIIF